MKSKQIYNGEWNNISNPRFVGCCDCGLVHKQEFRIGIKGYLQYRVKVNNKLTKEARKTKEFIKK